MRQQYHQLDPRKFRSAEFEKLKDRAEVRSAKAGEVYRDANYPNEYFTWHPFDAAERKLPGNDGIAGEWRMGAAEVN